MKEFNKFTSFRLYVKVKNECILKCLYCQLDSTGVGHDIGYLNRAIIPPSEDTLRPISVDESTA